MLIRCPRWVLLHLRLIRADGAFLACPNLPDDFRGYSDNT